MEYSHYTKYSDVNNFIKVNSSLFNTEYDKITFANLCDAIMEIIKHKDEQNFIDIDLIYEIIYVPFLKSMLEHQNDLIETISNLMKYGTKITLCNEDFEHVKAELIKKDVNEQRKNNI